MLRRPPRPALRPFVRLLWATDGGAGEPGGAGREAVLPTGAMHLVFRTAGGPLRLFEGPGDLAGRTTGGAVVGGARAAPYLREVPAASRSVGAMLEPGAASLLAGVPADALAGRHTPLEDLWGRAASAEAHERLALAPSPAAALELLEALLAARLPRVRGVHPAVAEALALFPWSAVRRAVERSGVSHRRFIALFRREVGLAPKVYCRVLRFQAAVGLVGAAADGALGDVALRAGYADQAHLGREFRELSGLSPGAYRRLAPANANHVPLDPSRSIPFKIARSGLATVELERSEP
jgi:AraC-like DNA-binding protein